MKSKPSKVEVELLKRAGVKPKKEEKRKKLLLRIAEAVNKMDQKKYLRLSDDAQSWYEKAVEAAGEGNDMPDPSAPKKLNLKEKQAQLKLSKKKAKKKKPEVPSWKKLSRMDTDELEEVGEEHEIEFPDKDFEDLESVQRFVAKELGIARPKKKKAARKEEEITWGKVHRMGDSALSELAEENKISLGKREWDSMKQVQDYVCKRLRIKAPAGARITVTAKKSKPKKVKKAAQKKVQKAAPKKPETLRRHPLSWYTGKLRGIGIKGQVLDKMMVVVRKM